MGGWCSQKLMPRRGSHSSPGRLLYSLGAIFSESSYSAPTTLCLKNPAESISDTALVSLVNRLPARTA
jgi:hypothetical protein